MTKRIRGDERMSDSLFHLLINLEDRDRCERILRAIAEVHKIWASNIWSIVLAAFGREVKFERDSLDDMREVEKELRLRPLALLGDYQRWWWLTKAQKVAFQKRVRTHIAHQRKRPMRYPARIASLQGLLGGWRPRRRRAPRIF